MKQMQEFSAGTDFSFRVPAGIESPAVGRMSDWLKRKLAYLAEHRRDLLLTASATLCITGITLAASYLFFIQLAAHGW